MGEVSLATSLWNKAKDTAKKYYDEYIGSANAQAGEKDKNDQQEIVVKFNAGVVVDREKNLTNKQDLNLLFRKYELSSIAPLRKGKGSFNFYKINVPAATDAKALVKELKSFSYVEIAEEPVKRDLLATIPNDTLFAQQWNLNIIQAPDAWDIQKGSGSVVVAVVDTGIDYNHEDLNALIWENTAEKNGTPGVDDDGNGYIDDIRGWNFVDNNNDPMDTDGHGTRVASIIGAETNNGQGIAGLNWNVKLMALIGGLPYAADNGAQIINMSYGGTLYSAVEEAMMNDFYNEGIVLVAGAGNTTGENLIYPCAHEKVICVGGSDDTDQPMYAYGKQLDVLAPAKWPIPVAKNGGGYTSGSQTSIATAHVSGLAALLLAQDPTLTNVEVSNVIFNSCDDLKTQGWDYVSGYGRINAYRALNEMNKYSYPDARVFWPRPGETVGPGTIEIKGKAAQGQNAFDHYAIEWAEASAPGIWYTTGVTLENNGQSTVADGKLGSINFGFAPATKTDVLVRLTAYDSLSNSRLSTSNFTVDTSIMPGWPYTGTADATLADLNGDKVDEIVFAYNDIRANTCNLNAVNANFTPRPGFPTQIKNHECSVSDLRGGEINGTGTSNIFFFNNTDKQIDGFSSAGNRLAGWPFATNASGSSVSLFDINKDGSSETLVGYIGAYPQSSSALGQNGATLWSVPDLGSLHPAGDLNNNGSTELIGFTLSSASLKTFDWQGNGLPNPTYTCGIWTGRVAGDFNADGKSEFIFSCNGELHALNENSNELPGFPVSGLGVNAAVSALGDLNNDGQAEIVLTGTTSGIQIYQSNGTPYPGWSDPGGYDGISISALADADGDGKIDLIGIGQTAGAPGVYAFKDNGTSVAGFPKTPGSWTSIYKIAIGDVNGDGKWELLVSGSNSSVGGLAAYQLQGNARTGGKDWGVRGLSSFGPGFYDPTSPTITHSPVSSGEAGEATVFNATIKDPAGAWAKLYYRAQGSGSYSSIVMPRTGGDNFSVSRDLDVGDYEYYIETWDLYKNYAYSPATPATLSFSVDDTKRPAIEHTCITSVELGGTLDIKAQITDASSIDRALLFHAPQGIFDLYVTNMQPSGSEYRAQVTNLVRDYRYYLSARDEYGYETTTTTCNVTVNDVKAPQIQYLPVTQARIGEDIPIESAVTDDGEVKRVSLFFRRIGQSQYSQLNMTLSVGLYRATIPAVQTGMEGLEYYIEAEDMAGNAAQTPINTINILDESSPTIQHQIINQANAGTDIIFGADISDNVEVSQALLYYRANGGAWSSLPMQAAGTNYTAVLPGSEVAFGKIDYYLFAADQSNNQTFEPLNAPANFYGINVVDLLGPSISHQQAVTEINVGEKLSLEATISDNVSVAKGEVCYGQNICQPLDGTAHPIYRAEVSAAMVQAAADNDLFTYYFKAYDQSNNLSQSPNYQITVINPNDGGNDDVSDDDTGGDDAGTGNDTTVGDDTGGGDNTFDVNPPGDATADVPDIPYFPPDGGDTTSDDVTGGNDVTNGDDDVVDEPEIDGKNGHPKEKESNCTGCSCSVIR